MTGISCDKKEIRRELIRRRAALDRDDRDLFDKAILDALTSLDEYKKADLILTYVSYNDEVDTLNLIDRCLSEGKPVACPRCRVEDDRYLLDFYRITSRDDLVKGYKGIPEPIGNELSKLGDEDMVNALIIVPMVGYDRESNRIGYGKGFYDRFLAAHKGLTSIGLAYRCQEYEKLPADEFDIRPDIIINES